jgi:hypothetical protein
MQTTEQLKQQFIDMEKLEIPKFPCGRYRVGFGGNLYYLDRDGGLELIGEWGRNNMRVS